MSVRNLHIGGGKAGLMKRDFKAYRRLYYFLRAVLFPFYRLKLIGRENVPDGPAVFCANHSSNLDPVFMAFAAGINTHLHFMGKIELFRTPVLSSVYKSIGSFSVDRGHGDVGAIKTAMMYLKAGEKVGIFPEGARVRTDEKGAAKRGAVRIADQMSVPIVPVYIPRNKIIFHSYTLVIGKPYFVNPEHKKLSLTDYSAAAETLMARISALREETAK